MAKRGILKRLGIVRNVIKEDILCFAVPAMIVFYLEVRFCARDGLNGLWGTMWS
jgi:hypothetical protein